MTKFALNIFSNGYIICTFEYFNYVSSSLCSINNQRDGHERRRIRLLSSDLNCFPSLLNWRFAYQNVQKHRI